MYIRGVQCDNCKEINNTETIHIDAIPGWIVVNLHKQPIVHFCSLQCLIDWASNRSDQPEKKDGEE